MYDLVIFGVVRIPSLTAIGISSDQMQMTGALLLNFQMAGMVLGGFVWGLLGDKIGRVKILFASIFIYSLANLFNAFVGSIEQYAILRLMAGFGLAGEIGVAVTLVTEQMHQELRGYGTTIIGLAGMIGGILAATIGTKLSWQFSYILGGLMGLCLLVARISVHESRLFDSKIKGDFLRNLRLLFLSPHRALNFFRFIMIGIPIWYISGILVLFSPEFATEFGVNEVVLVGYAVIWNYLGSFFGNIAAGILSHKLQSRKNAILVFLAFTILTLIEFFFGLRQASAARFYLVCFLFGIGNGYWTLLITMAAEKFGTNLRATVATSIPNLIRGAVIPLSLAFQLLKEGGTPIHAALGLGVICLTLALVSLTSIKDTYYSDLNFEEF